MRGEAGDKIWFPASPRLAGILEGETREEHRKIGGWQDIMKDEEDEEVVREVLFRTLHLTNVGRPLGLETVRRCHLRRREGRFA
jgi:hypothetical protein